ncbi:MAG: hypothetical protein ACLP7P_08540 [Rhodomicrobium sp.]
MANDLVVVEKRKTGRPSVYDPAMCEIVIACGREGMCREEIAAVLDISHKTFSRWLAEHEDFCQAATRAKELEYAWWLSAGRRGQFKRGWNAQGWALQMRNRFAERFRIRDAEAGDAPQDATGVRDAMERKLSRIAEARRAQEVSGESH